MRKKHYKAPYVLKEVTVHLESGFLQGSVITNETGIETSGQTVEKRDFEDSGFSHIWK